MEVKKNVVPLHSQSKGCRQHNAEIAQLVEHNLAKVGVASSSLVFRSTKKSSPNGLLFSFDTMTRPNAIVTVVALYDKPQMLPLPEMYGKNLTFKTGGVDGCDCAEILSLIEAGKIDTTPLITHRYKLADIAEAYHLFEDKLDGVIKVAIYNN